MHFFCFKCVAARHSLSSAICRLDFLETQLQEKTSIGIFPKATFSKNRQSGLSRKPFLSEIDNRELPEAHFYLKTQIGNVPNLKILKRSNRDFPENEYKFSLSGKNSALCSWFRNKARGFFVLEDSETKRAENCSSSEWRTLFRMKSSFRMCFEIYMLYLLQMLK